MAKNAKFNRGHTNKYFAAALRGTNLDELYERGDEDDTLHGGLVPRQKVFSAAAKTPKNADGSRMTQEQIDADKARKAAEWVAKQKASDTELAKRITALIAPPQA